MEYEFDKFKYLGGTASKDSLDLMLDTLIDGKLLDIPINDIGDFIDSYSDILINPLYMTPIIPIDPILGKSIASN